MFKNRKLGKIFLILFAVLIVVCSLVAYAAYNKIFANNVNSDIKKSFFLYIPTGANFTTLADTLKKHKVLKDFESFKWVCQKKNYINKIKSGRYKIKPSMSNNDLVNLLRSGNQKAVKLTINNVRTKSELATKISRQLELDYSQIIKLFNNKKFLQKYGFNPDNVLSMFIPNTYQFYWNTSAEKFFVKMNNEYKKFWNKERSSKAKKLNMSKLEVSVLASIVQAEQSKHNDEKPKIAGLYINRLKRGIPLESDPTLVYAIGDFSIRRVLNKHKEVDSPFNTYKNLGLPPAPINLPEISSLDAVLNYQKHNYIFMCAKADFSGYHNFAKNITMHNAYAKQYHRALNKRKIMK